MIHQIQSAGETLDALAGALRHRRDASPIAGQEMNDLIPLAHIDHPQHDGLALRVSRFGHESGAGGERLHADRLHTDRLHTDRLHTDRLHTDRLHT